MACFTKVVESKRTPSSEVQEKREKVFTVEGDKVTGFNLMPPQGGPVVYTRVESK